LRSGSAAWLSWSSRWRSLREQSKIGWRRDRLVDQQSHHLLSNIAFIKVATRKILEKMKQDGNLRSFEGSSVVLSDGDEFDDKDNDDGGDGALCPIDGGDMIPNEAGQNPQKPAKSAIGCRPSGPTNTRRVYGNMAGFEDEDSLDSDSDMLLDGDTDSEDDEEVNEMAAESLKNRKYAKLAKVIDNNSDDDF
jgi:hypothetical protein